MMRIIRKRKKEREREKEAEANDDRWSLKWTTVTKAIHRVILMSSNVEIAEEPNAPGRSFEALQRNAVTNRTIQSVIDLSDPISAIKCLTRNYPSVF